MAKKTTKSSKTAPVKAPTKSEIFRNIAEKTGLSRKDVKAVFEELTVQVGKVVKKGTPFTIPGLAKIVVRRKPATPAGKRPNPFKPGEMIEVKAKPARNVIRVRPLKGLKEMV